MLTFELVLLPRGGLLNTFASNEWAKFVILLMRALL